MAETLYKIRCEDGTELPGAWPLPEAKKRALWEQGACTFIALTAQEMREEHERNLRFALGHEED